MSSIQDRINALKAASGGGGADMVKAKGPSSTLVVQKEKEEKKSAGEGGGGGGGERRMSIQERLAALKEAQGGNTAADKPPVAKPGAVSSIAASKFGNKAETSKVPEKVASETPAGTTVGKQPEVKKEEVPPTAPAVEKEKEKEKPNEGGEEKSMSIQERLAALKGSQGGSTAADKPPIARPGALSSIAASIGNKVTAVAAMSKPPESKPEAKPPVVQPPKEEPPKEEPPKEEPPKEEPPKEEPPKEEPPKEEPPKEELPKKEEESVTNAMKKDPLGLNQSSPKVEPAAGDSADNETDRSSMPKRVSTGLAARMGGLDLSKVGMIGGPRPMCGSLGGGPESSPKEPKTVSNVATNDDGKVEVDNALNKATVKKGGRKAPTRKAFKADDDD